MEQPNETIGIADNQPHKSATGVPFVKGDPRINRAGRPKGKTLKEFAREMLMSLSDEDKIKYLKKIDPDMVWKMAEGNPQNDVTSGGEAFSPVPIYNGGAVQRYDSNEKDIQPKPEN